MHLIIEFLDGALTINALSKLHVQVNKTAHMYNIVQCT